MRLITVHYFCHLISLVEIFGLFLGPFGVMTYGCYVNGYTYKDGEMMMWVAKRSPTKQTYPNLLDQFVSWLSIS
jgi:hypothetical protein